jgi:tetratricopeptide (TPR) repeat protein
MPKVCLLVLCLAGSSLFAQKRQFKTQAEFDIYTEVTKDLTAKNGQKAITDLDSWKQQFPDSEFKDDRTALYIQAYAAANQPGKAIDAGGEILNKDVHPGVLYTIATSIQRVPDPTPAQLATATEAARKMQALDKAPEGVTPEAWEQARGEMQTAAKATLLYAALLPSAQAIKRKDCAAAETAAMQAIKDFPESGQAAWSLGSAELCLKKGPAAIYEFARAASVDPQTGMVDPKWQQETAKPYFEKIYNQYHGPDPEGMKQLKALALASPLPPAGFDLKSTVDRGNEEQAAFQRAHPELAMWMTIKGALTAQDGDQYYESSVKNAVLPKLIGTVVEAKPACRPTELLLAVHAPNAPSSEPEIALKFDKPLRGKVDTGSEIKFEAVARDFSRQPFLLTMDADPSKIEGMSVTPCAAGKAK